MIRAHRAGVIPAGGLDWLIPEPEPWMLGAPCSQVDPELWFPEKGGSTREAKRICRSCDVRDKCLAYALEHGERFGVYGGLSPKERSRLAPQIELEEAA